MARFSSTTTTRTQQMNIFILLSLWSYITLCSSSFLRRHTPAEATSSSSPEEVRQHKRPVSCCWPSIAALLPRPHARPGIAASAASASWHPHARPGIAESTDPSNMSAILGFDLSTQSCKALLYKDSSAGVVQGGTDGGGGGEILAEEQVVFSRDLPHYGTDSGLR